MSDDEELLPEDDSIFEGLINQSLNQSTDGLVDDSFSADLPEIGTSTPVAKGKRKGKNLPVPEAPTRVLRSQSPAVSSPGRAPSPGPSSASPRRSSRLSLKTQSPSQHQNSPARSSSPTPNTSSPRRSQRNSSIAQPLSPQPSTSRCQSRKAPQPQTNVQRTGSENIPSKEASKRIKCRECTATLANERTFAVHKQLHSLKRALAKVSSSDDFLENVPILLQETVQRILKEPYVGTYATDIINLCEFFGKSLENLNECHEELFKFLHSHLYPLIGDCQGVFSSSVSSVMYVGVNRLLNNEDFVRNLKMHVLGLVDISNPSVSVLNIFVASLMLNLSCVVVIFITRKIHGSTSNDEVRKKRSDDKVDSVTFLQLCYHIGGSVVNGFMYKGEKYKKTNPVWDVFVGILKKNFLASEAVSSKCADSVVEFTKDKDRGGLKHISQEALDFFVVLFDVLMSLEGNDGSLPSDIVVNTVLKDNTLLCLWDVLVGCELQEDSSLDFLMQMTESCRLVVLKGIMKRRLNDHLKKAYAAVSLRSKLCE